MLSVREKEKTVRRNSAPASSQNHTLGPMTTARRCRLLPASATQGSIPMSNADRSSMARAARILAQGGRPDSNRNLEDHDLGCCRYTTTAMYRACFSHFGSDPTPKERRKIIMARAAGRIFRRGPDSNRNLEDHDLGCCRYTTTAT
jgi:hypothetical protein